MGTPRAFLKVRKVPKFMCFFTSHFFCGRTDEHLRDTAVNVTGRKGQIGLICGNLHASTELRKYHVAEKWHVRVLRHEIVCRLQYGLKMAR